MEPWPQFLQFQDPQWHLVLRTLATLEGPIRAVDVVIPSGDVCYFPDQPFTELDGLKIGVNLSKAKAALADRLWEKLQNGRLTLKQHDQVVADYLKGMSELIRTRDQFMRKYDIVNPPAAAVIKAKIATLEKQWKKVNRPTKERIGARITQLSELFYVEKPVSPPVVQRDRHCTEHNLAYIFQCDLAEIPNFDPKLSAEDWTKLKADFARAHGKIPLVVFAPVQKWPPVLMDLPAHILDVMAGYPMLFGGLNHEGQPHCVVVQGLGVYDPNPSKKELDTWNDIQVFMHIEDVRQRWGDEVAALPSLELQWVEVSDAKVDPDFPALVAEGQELRRSFDAQTRGMRG